MSTVIYFPLTLRLITDRGEQYYCLDWHFQIVSEMSILILCISQCALNNPKSVTAK